MAHTGAQHQRTEREAALRRRLGIPDDAARVLVFGESSHWDPDWLYTSEEYFGRYVCRNLDRAIEELLREPRRVYSVECLFFLRMYWERRPEQQAKVRALVNEGRLRLTSSGVTTADTIVPRPEAILRDWLLGQEWLRRNGMIQEPRLAYFTDSFGCSPALPSLLKAAGFDYTAITRVDGMYFAAADYESAGRFPRPGSSAELLAKEERTTDFVWRGPDGAGVLCHWNAFTYGQGDMLAHRGLTRIYLFPLAWPARSDRHIARRIGSYVAQLAPLSRTPYLFCPIGFDFNPPIPGLVELLDRYNKAVYPETGVWAINAGLDDYLELVGCHRQLLPVLELDPNPYWTGFYTSRPSLKRQCHELVESLLLAERLALQPGNEAAARTINDELADAWWVAATANHHDFITGTSPDRVVEAEQEPWLAQAAKTAQAAIERLRAGMPAVRRSMGRKADLPEWRRLDGGVEVRTPHYALEVAEDVGGAIVRAWHPETQRTLLPSVSNDLICYRDSGGLWRMGHEFRGGSLRELCRASAQPGRLEVRETANGLEVSCVSQLGSESVERVASFRADSPVMRFRVRGRAPEGCTVTAAFATGLRASLLAMDVAGGVVVRPREKVYVPTFWPLQSFWHGWDAGSGRGVALLLGLPGAVACRSDGLVEAIALRNATRERAWGLLPIPATPATGHERHTVTFDYGLLFTSAGDWRANRLWALAGELRDNPWPEGEQAVRWETIPDPVTVDPEEVWITAVKPASRGEGIILRLYTFEPAGLAVRLALVGKKVLAAFLCDSRERDLEVLPVREGTVHLAMPGALATVRLLPEA